MTPAAYDKIGIDYAYVRQPDPRIFAQLKNELGEAKSALCVGAGTGSYEPRLPRTVAVEPSAQMIHQRSGNAAPVVQAEAEKLPFVDGSFEVALAILTIHHWHDLKAGLREMQRIASRVVILTWDPEARDRFWLTNEYFPEFIEQDLCRFPTLNTLSQALGTNSSTEVVPLHNDCRDGFLGAYWSRPEAYLRDDVQRGISSFGQAQKTTVQKGLKRLRRDLETGAWQRRHSDLLTREALDLGYRLVCS